MTDTQAARRVVISLEAYYLNPVFPPSFSLHLSPFTKKQASLGTKGKAWRSATLSGSQCGVCVGVSVVVNCG